MASRVGRKVYNDPRWRVVRLAVLKRDGYRCTNCNRPGRLEVHHNYPVHKFPKRDHFDPRHLRSICRTCHFAEHYLAKVLPARREWIAYTANGC